jgi:hypothetical protein
MGQRNEIRPIDFYFSNSIKQRTMLPVYGMGELEDVKQLLLLKHNR